MAMMILVMTTMILVMAIKADAYRDGDDGDDGDYGWLNKLSLVMFVNYWGIGEAMRTTTAMLACYVDRREKMLRKCDSFKSAFVNYTQNHAL